MLNSGEQMEKQYNEAMKRDAEARGAGELVGRLFIEPCADSQAYYRVIKTTRASAWLEHVPLYDAWTLEWVEDMGRKIPIALAKKNVWRRDEMDAMWRRK